MSDDLINRKVAIEAAYQGLQEPANSERWKRILGNLKAVPSDQQWIPFEKQKPKDKQKVLVWFEYFRFGEYQCHYQTFGLTTYPYTNFINGSSGWTDLRIIAWQPLPEPYIEQEGKQ